MIFLASSLKFKKAELVSKDFAGLISASDSAVEAAVFAEFISRADSVKEPNNLLFIFEAPENISLVEPPIASPPIAPPNAPFAISSGISSILPSARARAKPSVAPERAPSIVISTP